MRHTAVHATPGSMPRAARSACTKAATPGSAGSGVRHDQPLMAHWMDHAAFLPPSPCAAVHRFTCAFWRPSNGTTHALTKLVCIVRAAYVIGFGSPVRRPMCDHGRASPAKYLS